jgi:hypothetical protein
VRGPLERVLGAPSLFLMIATTAWATPLTRRLAVDHGRMRSSLCRSF